eukprot:GEMP01005343.1.p1 GENE.GEMP01005343.1~~GEMP01005343.1.p1  ORF type:complete len:753 (+),score=156.63 GEMP01005343.1:136-2394(+)
MALLPKDATMLSPRTTESGDMAWADGRVAGSPNSTEDVRPLLVLSPLPHSWQSSESPTATIMPTCEPARTSTETFVSEFTPAPSPISEQPATALDSAERLRKRLPLPRPRRPSDVSVAFDAGAKISVPLNLGSPSLYPCNAVDLCTDHAPFHLGSPSMRTQLSRDLNVDVESMDLDARVASRQTDQTMGAPDGLVRSKLNLVSTQVQRKLTSSCSNLVKHGSSHMPNYLMWMVIISIGVLVGLVNYLMVFVGEKFVEWKFHTIKDAAKTHGVAGALLLPVFAVILCFIASMMVCIWAPMVAGSGLPEIKGYLNGYAMPGLFETRKHWIRIAGIMLTVAAGMPVGREGPMVCIGGSCGILVVQQILKPRFVRRVKVESDLDGNSKRLEVLDEENYAQLKRVACTLGASCGIAVAFHAPIGGVLYMMEEVAGVFKWTPQITFQAFVCTVTAVLVSTGLLEVSPYEFHQLVLFRHPTTKDSQIWNALDIVFIIFMGTACGCLSAFFTSMKIKIWKLRKTWIWRRRRAFRVLEVSVFALIVGLAWAYAPLILPCEPLPSASTVTPQASAARRSLSHDDSRGFVDYDCIEEHPHYYSELASLWWAGEEEAVVHLYASGDSFVRIEAAAIALLIYVPLAMAMAGLAIPMGMFIPNLFMGACVGRALGEALKLGGFNVAKPGVYAFIGSGAMLGGFTHMTIAIVALLVEVTEDLSAILPLVVGVAVGRFPNISSSPLRRATCTAEESATAHGRSAVLPR